MKLKILAFILSVDIMQMNGLKAPPYLLSSIYNIFKFNLLRPWSYPKELHTPKMKGKKRSKVGMQL